MSESKGISSMRYFPWVKDDEDDAFAWITQDSDFLMHCMDSYLLHEGESVKSWFPTDSVFQLSDDYGVKLTDSIPNTLHLLIVSEKLKGVLEEKSGAEIEFLPVHVRNQKGRLIPERYFIANPLGTVECVDHAQSKFAASSIRPDQVFHFYRLALDRAKIPPDARLFRLKEKSNLVIVRQDLADDILLAGCDGMLFQLMESYGEEWGALRE
ncbi:hypothetical protein JY651_01635 [Pyxidicoccus parkwayensis]|uniref:Immunity MXAN-0049 protein domain-containing protein n=1 Tax=Pyxidicoccus parkwayensis TaxID=2813578 RepID=A0ABX7NZ17_9BACT|nr:DUF1629 domain-containing protein [Pyxidicoccus parkwaysis]QSQ23713.1 hypothetical protein JY651_01635 [Pyxidicoccus parkwaysis]